MVRKVTGESRLDDTEEQGEGAVLENVQEVGARKVCERAFSRNLRGRNE